MKDAQKKKKKFLLVSVSRFQQFKKWLARFLNI